MSESDRRREDGSEDARTLDPAIQKHVTGAQPDPERQADARLGEKTPRNRRIRKYSGRSRAVSSRPHRTKDRRPRRTITPQGPLRAIRILESRPIEKRRTRPSRIFLNATAYTVDLELFRFRRGGEKRETTLRTQIPEIVSRVPFFGPSDLWPFPRHLRNTPIFV